MLKNAHRAIELGSHGIDLNCGCPSKTVNGSNGGAALLKQPELIYRATQALRQTVPSHLPVSVKVRLGWDCTSQALKLPTQYNKVAPLKSPFTAEPKPMGIVPIASIGRKSVK